MRLTRKQIDLLKRRRIVVLATSDKKGKPHAILVEVNQVKGDKIIITDNEMVRTRTNLLENNQVALSAFEDDFSYCLKISGRAIYYSSGKYFNFVKGLPTNKNYSPKGVVVVVAKEAAEVK